MKYLSLIICLGIKLLIVNPATAVVEVKDDLGRMIRLEQSATRIISLAPHITENLFSAGAGGQLVGAVSYSDYPQQAKSIPIIGSYNNINVELIFAAQPDVIIAWKEGNQKQQVEKLIDMGLTVYVNNPETLEDIAKSIKQFGILAGTAQTAEYNSRLFLNKLQSLRDKYSKRKKVSVFYQAWHQPLLTVNAQQSIGRIIELCSGENIFAELSGLTPQVGIEAVLVANPAAIIASGMDESRPEWLDDWKKWAFLQAVKQKHLFFVPPDIIQRHSTRILLGAELICQSLQTVREANSKKQDAK